MLAHAFTSASLALLVRLLDRPEVGVEAAEAGVASAGSAVASLSSRFGAAAATAAVSTSAGADDDASLFRFRRDDRLGVVAGDAAGEGVGVLAASTLLLLLTRHAQFEFVTIFSPIHGQSHPIPLTRNPADSGFF